MSPQYANSNSLPSTVTAVAASQVAQSGQLPKLYVYNRSGSVVATSVATAVAADGVTVTFPYPATAYGALPPDFYGTAIVNFDSGGNPSYAGSGGFFTIGQVNTSQTSPFGVAAGVNDITTDDCVDSDPDSGEHSDVDCNEYDNDEHFPIVSLSQAAMLSWNGNTVSVGSNPTAVVAYGTGSTSSSSSTYGETIETQQNGTAYALVVNTGGNSVSIVDLLNVNTVATIPVGNTPTGAVISADLSTAYVSNQADGTISEINLSTNSVSSTVYVGANLTTLDLDSNGHLWAGGTNFLTELNQGSLSNVQTITVSGLVSSLAISNGTGQVAATLKSSSGTTSTVQSYAMSSGTATSLATFTPNSAAQLGTGTVVSANYANSFVITATPTGFLVSDLGTGTTFITGSTAGPVRSIAVDPDFGYVYMTVPSTNSIITVPLPPLPTS